MPIDRIVFSQVTDFMPMHDFRRCVNRYGGNQKVQNSTCMDQFLCMAFAQLTYRDSLRDTVTRLEVLKPKLFHVGIRGKLARSTLSEANEIRDWRIYSDLA